VVSKLRNDVRGLPRSQKNNQYSQYSQYSQCSICTRSPEYAKTVAMKVIRSEIDPRLPAVAPAKAGPPALGPCLPAATPAKAGAPALDLDATLQFSVFRFLLSAFCFYLSADVTSLQREAHEAQRIALERERIQMQVSNAEWQRKKDLHHAETRALNAQSLPDALPPPPGGLRTQVR